MKKIKKVIIGFTAGIVCGMFTSGGGLILVPSFIYILKKGDKISRGTAGFCILPMVLITSFFYYKSNYINWETGILTALGGIFGGIVGAKLLKKIPTIYIRILYIIFLIVISLKILLV